MCHDTEFLRQIHNYIADPLLVETWLQQQLVRLALDPGHRDEFNFGPLGGYRVLTLYAVKCARTFLGPKPDQHWVEQRGFRIRLSAGDSWIEHHSLECVLVKACSLYLAPRILELFVHADAKHAEPSLVYPNCWQSQILRGAL